MPQQDNRSDVWTWFVKCDGRKKAKCNLCGKELAFHGGTTNLREHLSAKHPLDYKYKRKEDGSQKKFDVYTRHCSKACHKVITEKIFGLIIQDMRPVAMVEEQGFRDMMTYLEPGYTIPSRKQFTALIQHKHDLAKEELKLKMKEKAIGMVLTTDIWTSVAIRHEVNYYCIVIYYYYLEILPIVLLLLLQVNCNVTYYYYFKICNCYYYYYYY